MRVFPSLSFPHKIHPVGYLTEEGDEPTRGPVEPGLNSVLRVLVFEDVFGVAKPIVEEQQLRAIKIMIRSS